jgi:hypothetical protein
LKKFKKQPSKQKILENRKNPLKKQKEKSGKQNRKIENHAIQKKLGMR